MPLPGPSEAAVVAKVGTAVARGLKQANPPIQWPNARESLLELFSLLVAWCEDAADTKEYAYQKLSHGESVLKPPSQTANRKWFGFGYTGYIETTRSDINRIVDGHAPLLKRWRASGRRQAARRSLRTILQAYSPDLLGQFESAVEARADWVKKNRRIFDEWFTSNTGTPRETYEIIQDMNQTYDDLVRAAELVRVYLSENFPFPVESGW